MSRHTVTIEGSTFHVNSFSRPGATETPLQLMRRHLMRNAEKEFKAGAFSSDEPGNFFDNPS